MKACPFCAEQIQDAAIKCRFCGEMLGAAPQAEPKKVAVPTDALTNQIILSAEEVQRKVGEVEALIRSGSTVKALKNARHLQALIRSGSNSSEYAKQLASIEKAIEAIEHFDTVVPGGALRGMLAIDLASVSGSRVAGMLLLIGGIGALVAGFAMDTSVAVPGGEAIGIARVNNIGLMQNKQNLIWIGGLGFIGGLILMAVSGGPTEPASSKATSFAARILLYGFLAAVVVGFLLFLPAP